MRGGRAPGGSELRRLLSTEATLLPELPWWFAGQAQSDAPWFLVYDGWLVLPLVHREHSRIRRYVAVTCLVRGIAPAMLAAARRPRRRRRASKVRVEATVVRQAPHRQVRRKRRHRPVDRSLPWLGEPDDD